MSKVIHFEIPADDPKRAKNYEGVFNWKIENGNMEIMACFNRI